MRQLQIDRALNSALSKGLITQSEKLDLMALGYKNYSLFEKTINAFDQVGTDPLKSLNDKEKAERIAAEILTDEQCFVKYEEIKENPAAIQKLKADTPFLYKRIYDGWNNFQENPENYTYDWLQKNDPAKLMEIEIKNPALFNRLLDEYEANLI